MALKGDLEQIRDLADSALKRIRLIQQAKSFVEGGESLPIDITTEQKQAWRAERDAFQSAIWTIAKTWGLP